MSNTTVFDSNMNKLKQNVEELKNLKFEKGLVSNFLSLIGKGSVSEEALTAHNDFINKITESYTANMKAMLSLTEKMKKENLYNNVMMEKMSDYITKLKLSLDKQKASIKNSEETIKAHKNTIDSLEIQNKKFKEANDVLDISNTDLIEKNEEQKQTNQTLTSQNQEQQERIAEMEEDLTQLTTQLTKQTETLNVQTEEIKNITNSNADLSTQLANLKTQQEISERDAKKAADVFEKITQTQAENINKIKKDKEKAIAGLRNSAKNKLKKQKEDFIKEIAGIREDSKKSNAEKEENIKRITEVHTKQQNKITEQQNKILATSNATIGQLKKELTSLKTGKKLDVETDEKKIKMLRTVTRVLPLSWKNSKGFNIGNVTTYVRGEKPYSATDTIDYYLHTLFKGENVSNTGKIIHHTSRDVPIIGNPNKVSGGKKIKKQKNMLKTSKHIKPVTNNKTKKQRKNKIHNKKK